MRRQNKLHYHHSFLVAHFFAGQSFRFNRFLFSFSFVLSNMQIKSPRKLCSITKRKQVEKSEKFINEEKKTENTQPNKKWQFHLHSITTTTGFLRKSTNKKRKYKMQRENMHKEAHSHQYHHILLIWTGAH